MHVSVLVYIRACEYACVRLCVYMSILVCIRASVCVCYPPARTNTPVKPRLMRVCTHVCVRMCVYVYVCVCVCVLSTCMCTNTPVTPQLKGGLHLLLVRAVPAKPQNLYCRVH